MARPIHIACLQTRPRPDFETATTEAVSLAEKAVQSGAQILFLPEYCGGLKEDGPVLVPPLASEDTHPVLAAVRQFAAQNKVWISVGSIAITGPNGTILNRGYLLDDQGDICGHYDKINMFDVEISKDEAYRESDTVTPGERAILYETPFGQIGHTICYDLRFPQLYQSLARAGAEILAIPAAFNNITGAAHWHVLNRARAIENGAFVVSACAVGDIPGGTSAFGHSLIVDPWGTILADGGTTAGVISATIDLDDVAKTRARIPSLQQDRPYRIERIITGHST